MRTNVGNRKSRNARKRRLHGGGGAQRNYGRRARGRCPRAGRNAGPSPRTKVIGRDERFWRKANSEQRRASRKRQALPARERRRRLLPLSGAGRSPVLLSPSAPAGTANAHGARHRPAPAVPPGAASPGGHELGAGGAHPRDRGADGWSAGAAPRRTAALCSATGGQQSALPGPGPNRSPDPAQYRAGSGPAAYRTRGGRAAARGGGISRIRGRVWTAAGARPDAPAAGGVSSPAAGHSFGHSPDHAPGTASRLLDQGSH